MMKPKLTIPVLLFCFAFGLIAPGAVTAAEMKVESVLLWGTDDSKPPEGKNYKPIDPALKAKMEHLHLNWKNYFEVRRTNIVIKAGEGTKHAISDKCEVDFKNFDNTNVEVSLVGKGKEVMKRKQGLPKGEILVLGGNAPNATAWLVVLKRLE